MNKFYLMHKDTPVLSFKVSVDTSLFSGVSVIEIFNKEKLPVVFWKNEEYVKNNLYSWMLSRCFDINREDYYELTNFLSDNYSNHNYGSVPFCSLYTYAFSLSDKYWFKPVDEFLAGGFFEDNPIQFKVKPISYKELCNMTKTISEDVANIEKIIFFNRLKELRYVDYSKISLNSPDFNTYGNKLKIWKYKNGELVCEKFYKIEKNSNKIIPRDETEEMEKKLAISNFVRNNHFKYFLSYEKETDCSVISKYFLNENEEYLDLVQMFICKQPNKLNDKEIFKIAKKFGLKRKLYREYLKEMKAIKERFRITDKEFWDNLGFIMDADQKRIVGIMNRI